MKNQLTCEFDQVLDAYPVGDSRNEYVWVNEPCGVVNTNLDPPVGTAKYALPPFMREPGQPNEEIYSRQDLEDQKKFKSTWKKSRYTIRNYLSFTRDV